MLNLEYSIFPELTTARLVLRQLVPEYAIKLHQLRSDKEINQYIDRPASKNIHDALAHIGKINNLIANKQSMYWVVTLASDNNLIGTICFWNFDVLNDTIEIGYELMTEHQGKGIMAEAVNKVIDYGFNTINAKAITAFPSANNLKSVALLKKLNFVIDNTLQTDVHAKANNVLPYILKLSSNAD